MVSKQSKYLLFLVTFCIILLAPSANAAPPVTTVQEFPEGYIIVENPHQYLEQNQDYQYNFFVYNYSTGVLLDNATLTCNFFLANKTGELIFTGETEYFSDGHWGIDILGGNFSDIGTHPYRVNCQDGAGGALAGDFEVTKTGFVTSTSDAIIIFLSILVMFLVAGMLLTLAFRMNNGTFILIFYSLATIVFFMATLFSMTLLDNLTTQFEFVIEGYSTFVMVFKILLSMGVLAITLYAGLRALKMYKIKRGYEDDED